MKELIKQWEKNEERCRLLAGEANHHPLRQEALYASAEVYGLCASDLMRKLKEVEGK